MTNRGDSKTASPITQKGGKCNFQESWKFGKLNLFGRLYREAGKTRVDHEQRAMVLVREKNNIMTMKITVTIASLLT